MRTGVLLSALLLALLSSTRILRQSFTHPRNDLPEHIARMEPAIRAIPDNAIIGYFSDQLPDPTLPATPPYPVRYAFAPRMLVWYPDPAVEKWVVGDFIQPTDARRAGEKLGLRLVRELGPGTALYTR